MGKKEPEKGYEEPSKWYEDKSVEWYEGYFASEEKNREHQLTMLQTISGAIETTATMLDKLMNKEKNMVSSKKRL